jgi:hypothetical protein
LRHKGYRSRTFIGLDGPLTVRRARYQCATTGTMYHPADEVLALPTGQLTASLARRALRLGTMMGFEELQEELLEQHDVRVTDSTLDDLANACGLLAHGDRQAQVEKLEGLPVGVAREQAVTVKLPAPARLYISCDGITYRTRYRQADPEHKGQKRLVYQEMKVGTVFWQDAQEHWHKRVVNGRDNPARFGLDLWLLAVECGMLDCADVVFISDGGVWCNSVAEMYFQEARRILDWYHLSEHIWETGRVLYGPEEKAAKPWVNDCLDHLHDHGGSGLLRHLARSLATRTDPRQHEALTALMDYLRPRVSITDYPAYRAQGYVIGSGMMESTCKQVVGRRLKGVGMQWAEQGALAMATLVGLRLNGAWSAFWRTHPLCRLGPAVPLRLAA